MTCYLTNVKTAYCTTLLLLFMLISSVTVAQFQPIVSPLQTQWSADVDPENPLPEYPRPQMVRNDWKNLNGPWQWRAGTNGEVAPFGQDLGGTITVPFAIEATLSGVVEHHNRLWYRKLFTVPEEWSGQRILLHFGAIDWESEIFVNGVRMGEHRGGYDEITYDISDAISGPGEQEIVVRVFDPTRDYGQPRGKQTTDPQGIMYTAVTGIWQTVWIEPVASQRIENFALTPDVDNDRLSIRVNTQGADGLTVVATALNGATTVGTASASAGTELTIDVPNTRLWSPDDPFLYDLTIELRNSDAVVVDSVSSYFGMRKVSVDRSGDVPRLMLNDEPIFMYGPLDQGYWPEGLYTAPTDEALKFDIEQTLALGFNMSRKHIKVEPQRWYYWADKLGLLVWQDMPSPNSYDAPRDMPIDRPQFEVELRRMIETRYNSPSIVSWVIFNEFQGFFDPERLANLSKELDPTRLVNQGSGGPFSNAGDIRDYHNYQEPAVMTSKSLAAVCGEFGGVGLRLPNHLWGEPRAPYGEVTNASELVSRYQDLVDDLQSYKSLSGAQGGVYTEICDVENEINGFLSYDRVYKVDPARIKVINQRLIKQDLLEEFNLISISLDEPQTWRYTFSTPAEEWRALDYDDSQWSTGPGGFGGIENENANIGTPWSSQDIWIRKRFETNGLTREDLKYMTMAIFNDEDVEIYINGVLAFERQGFEISYVLRALNNDARFAINPDGDNVVAIRCKQTIGAQFIDFGLVAGRSLSLSGNGGVTVFGECGFSGNAVTLDEGYYTRQRLEALGITNNSLSSLRVADSLAVTAYDSDDFDGEWRIFNADDSCMLALFTDGATTWNNQTSSLIIGPDLGDNGLFGQYYNGMNFETLVTQRRDSAINFDWGLSAPHPAVNPERFSVRWTGQIEPEFSEEYTFFITSDNGRRLWIDDQLIIDQFIPDWDIEYSGKITLEAGRKYDIKVEYFDELFGANIRMSWQSASRSKQLVPQNRLFSEVSGGGGEGTVGIKANTRLRNTVLIYPNPAQHSLTVTCDHPIKNIVILNTQGQRILRTEQPNIDLSDFTPGVYIIQIELEEGVVSSMFIRQ